MNLTLIIDLENEYRKENQRVIAELMKKYAVILLQENENSWKELKADSMVVITDDIHAALKWEGYAILAIEHDRRIEGVRYTIENLETVEEKDIKVVHARKFHYPLVIKETERLIIREMTENDAEAMAVLYGDKDSTKFMNPLQDVVEDREFIRSYINHMYAFYGYGMWVVIRKEDGAFLGRAGIEHREIQKRIYHEIGYFIGSVYRRQGYGREAAEAVMETARELGIKQLVALIHEKNAPSIHLAEKLGFCFWEKYMDGEEFLIYRCRLSK